MQFYGGIKRWIKIIFYLSERGFDLFFFTVKFILKLPYSIFFLINIENIENVDYNLKSKITIKLLFFFFIKCKIYLKFHNLFKLI